MTWTLLKTVLRARRNGLMRLVEAGGAVRLDCLGGKCAKCCQLLGSPVVTETESAMLDCEHIVRGSGGAYIKSHRGACCLLRNGLCSVYENRPAGCREYPWYNIDGKLYYDAGCPGIRYDKDERPDVASIGPFENFFPSSAGVVVRLIRRLCVGKA